MKDRPASIHGVDLIERLRQPIVFFVLGCVGEQIDLPVHVGFESEEQHRGLLIPSAGQDGCLMRWSNVDWGDHEKGFPLFCYLLSR